MAPVISYSKLDRDLDLIDNEGGKARYKMKEPARQLYDRFSRYKDTVRNK